MKEGEDAKGVLQSKVPGTLQGLREGRTEWQGREPRPHRAGLAL
jgi:hypothetical protein